MFFCPNCNNSFLITQQENTLNNVNENPNTVSSSEVSVEKPKLVTGINTVNKAVFKCTNCGFIQEITPGTMVLRRTAAKLATVNNTEDYNKYKEMLNDSTLPHTRNYLCPNEKCSSYKDDALREAVFFKPNRHDYRIIYICKACETVW